MRLLRAALALWTLSLRQLVWSLNSLMMVFPIAGCVLFVLVQRYHRPTLGNRAFQEFSNEFVLTVFSAFLLPLIALAYTTSSLAGDREDRTLVYLVTRPIPRPLMLLMKLAACLPIVLGLAMAVLAGCSWLAGPPGLKALAIYWPGVLLLGFAYTCLFLLFAVWFRHATIVAVVYSLFVEIVLGNMPGMIKQWALNFYGRSLMLGWGKEHGLEMPPTNLFVPLTAEDAWLRLWLIALGALALATISFQRKEFRDLV
ncbi:MAG TPA: ABC transporter permease subunit [Pirellulales bacterium]